VCVRILVLVVVPRRIPFHTWQGSADVSEKRTAAFFGVEVCLILPWGWTKRLSQTSARLYHNARRYMPRNSIFNVRPILWCILFEILIWIPCVLVLTSWFLWTSRFVSDGWVKYGAFRWLSDRIGTAEQSTSGLHCPQKSCNVLTLHIPRGGPLRTPEGDFLWSCRNYIN